MQTDDEDSDVLEDVARIQPVVARLRQLVRSATILDLKASSPSYWADRDAGHGPPDSHMA